MKIFNSLSRQIEDFKPQADSPVTVYTCGPTVYDYQHIGNWFTYVRYDILIRTLQASGYQRKWVLNITDVGHLVSDADEGEDKLEKGARREGKTAWEVADFYTKDFLAGLSKMNIQKPDYIPRASQHIKEQIELISKLEDKGYAYTTGDGLYYDTSQFPEYSELARLNLEEQEAGSRVQANPEKRNPSDFALWKFSPKDKKRDMEWDSPWGRGFPGWHIECSAMAMKYLGETLDIHGGGIDHLPIHHTNEIAQSQAVTGKPLANYWFHANHILVDGHKISKSLNNGITLQQIEERGYSPEALRLLILQSHYRTQSQFSWDELDAADKRLKSLKATAALRWQPVAKPALSSDSFNNTYQEILNFFEDDLSTPSAIAAFNAWSDVFAGRLLSKSNEADFGNFLKNIDALTGLKLSEEPDIDDTQKALIAERQEVRANKDWAKSDELRSKLAKQKIGLNDTDFGPIWYRL